MPPWSRALLLTTALLAGCGGAEPPLPSVKGYRGITSLLAMPERMEVLEAPENFRPNQRHMRTGDGDVAEREALPCIQVKPTTRLRYRLDPAPDGAVLQVTCGVRRNGYRGSGSVTFRGLLDGEVCFEQIVNCSGDTPPEDMRWYPIEVPLEGARDLVLEARYEGSQQGGPVSGFGRLRIAVPFEAARQRSSSSRPNVVLVLIDTLRADRLSCYGHDRVTSPNLDRLAREGLRCEQAYSSSSWTIPGTASVLTGLSPPAHGLGFEDSNYLPDRLETLPRLFSQAGFSTAAFSTNPLVDGSRNFDQGFETFVNEPWAPTPLVIERIEEWITDVSQSRFFLYLHLTDPHAPYRASPEALARQGVELKEEFAGELLRTSVDRWYAGGGTGSAWVRRASESWSDVYDAEIDLCDAMLKRVLDALDRAGHGEDTVLCVTSDHGEEFLDHGLVGHFNQLYPESIRVPLIFWGPGVPQGEVLPTPVENRHAAQTLLSLAGLDIPSEMPGVDLTRPDSSSVLSRAGAFATARKGRLGDLDRRESIELGPMHCLVEGRWQLVSCAETLPPGHGFNRLFDLEVDPGCLVDVAADHPERVSAMRARIEAWLKEGSALQPELMPATEETRQLMRGLGYIGDEDG